MPATYYDIAEPKTYIIHDRPDDSASVRRLIKDGSEV